METHHGVLGPKQLHTFEEIVAPKLARRHIYKMLYMDRGPHGLFGAISASVDTLDASALPVLDDQPRNRFVGEDGAIVRFDKAAERDAQGARAAFGNDAPAHLLHHE